MKITFFKNEEHFYPRVSYVWENAEKVSDENNRKKFHKYVLLATTLPLLIFSIVFSRQMLSDYWFVIAALIFLLPLHELCHALFCLLSHRKVDRICFFPYTKTFSWIGAYVAPSFGIWNKTRAVLFYAFPLILLTALPTVLAFFFPELKTPLVFISLLNLSSSSIDITDIIGLLKLPSDMLNFINFSLTIKNKNEPLIIHQIFVTLELDKIYHRQFEYSNGKLSETETVKETNATLRLRGEFEEQFNIK